MDATSPPRLLLVEDSDGDATLIMHFLEQATPPIPPSCVTHARNGEEAIEALLGRGGLGKAGPFDLVLLDLRLPRKDGFEVLEAVRREGERLPATVVVLSTSDLESDVERARELGARDYVVKRFDIHEFRSDIHSIVARLIESEAAAPD